MYVVNDMVVRLPVVIRTIIISSVVTVGVAAEAYIVIYKMVIMIMMRV